jgi:hypothetical protein
MWLRLAACGSVGYVDFDQAVYRRHAANMSREYFSAMLPDIQQRKAAFDSFFGQDGQRLPEASALRDKIYLDLARAAVGRASAAFNEGRMDLSDELWQFSRSLHPNVVNSGPWIRLTFKHKIGLNAWRAVNRFRHKSLAKSRPQQRG